MKWVIRDVTKSDYGVDAEVEVFEEGRATGLSFKVQLKGTDSPKPTRSITFDDFDYWRSLDVPVLLGLWRSAASDLRAKWAHSHDPGLVKEGQKSTTVRFDEDDELRAWLEDIPRQLRLMRSIRTGTVRFPLPIAVDDPDPQVVARLHSALRSEITASGLDRVLVVAAAADDPILVTVNEKAMRVEFPLGITSDIGNGGRQAVTRIAWPMHSGPCLALCRSSRDPRGISARSDTPAAIVDGCRLC